MGYINDLVVTITEPAVGDDPADFPAQYATDKGHIKSSFPNITGAVTATQTELNVLDGITATTAELNQLDGIVPVDTTTTQSIAGVKTFTNRWEISGTGPFFVMEDTDAGTDKTKVRVYWYENGFLIRSVNDDNTTKTNLLQVGESAITYAGNTVFHSANIQDDDAMASASATDVASSESIKAYVDTAIAAVGGGVVQQIKVATSSPSAALDASYATQETVALTSVASGSYVIVFALGIYTVSSQIISQKITNSSGTIKSVGESSTHAINISNASLVSIAYDTAPGTGTVTYWLQAKEATNVSGTIDHAIMVAVEYTP